MAHEERCNALDILEYAHQVGIWSECHGQSTNDRNAADFCVRLWDKLSYIMDFGWWQYGIGVYSQDRKIEACLKFMAM